jgi:hypothetical protein
MASNVPLTVDVAVAGVVAVVVEVWPTLAALAA